MKKILLLGIVASAAFALTSCDKETVNSSTRTYTIPAYNLFNAKDGSGTAFVGIGNYKFTLKYPDATIETAVNEMALPDGGKITFATDPLKFNVRFVKIDDKPYEELQYRSTTPVADLKIENLTATVTQAAYAPGDVTVPGYERFLPGATKHFAVMQYTCNSVWDVRSFWPDMTFMGKTSTSYPGMQSQFENDKIRYRIYMRRDVANKLTGKADVIIYNAQFVASMPEITVVVKDLDVKFDDAGYTVSGADVIPYMLEAGALVEAKKFKFNKFEFSATGDLTVAKASYTVADVFKGSFSGNSIKK